MERVWKEFNAYLDRRNNKKYTPAYWNVNSKVLPFGTPFKKIRDGFELINSGDLAGSVRFLAQHEQVNILQRIMYNDPDMQDALARNQLAWAIGFPRFDELLRGRERPYVEESLRKIAAGGGVE